MPAEQIVVDLSSQAKGDIHSLDQEKAGRRECSS
jgi:hypothetical protein